MQILKNKNNPPAFILHSTARDFFFRRRFGFL